MSKVSKALEIDGCNPEIQEVKKAMKQAKDKRMHIRYLTIHLHFRNYSNSHIAKITDLDKHTVGNYIKAYKANGLKGLIMGKSTGAPRQLTAEQEQALFEVITTKTPDEVGFPNRKNWDSNIAREWVHNNFNVEYSHSGMHLVLHRLNLSFTRPTYTLVNADPQKQEEFKQQFELLKKPS